MCLNVYVKAIIPLLPKGRLHLSCICLKLADKYTPMPGSCGHHNWTDTNWLKTRLTVCVCVYKCVYSQVEETAETEGWISSLLLRLPSIILLTAFSRSFNFCPSYLPTFLSSLSSDCQFHFPLLMFFFLGAGDQSQSSYHRSQKIASVASFILKNK